MAVEKIQGPHISSIAMLAMVAERLKWYSVLLITRLNMMKSSLRGFLVIIILGSSIMVSFERTNIENIVQCCMVSGCFSLFFHVIIKFLW